MAYLKPLVQEQVGNDCSEQLVRHVTCDMYNVTTLLEQIENWNNNGFSLMREAQLTGKHHASNYKSALQYKAQVHKSLRKRLDACKTAGPFLWNGDLTNLPWADCAINPMGAVPYKDDLSRARACDDMLCNEVSIAPYFKQSALQQIRDRSFPYCEYAKSDVEAAFTCMHMSSSDLPWLLFAWYHIDDTTFAGSDQDCLYLHTHGNFGPRPMPFEFTMLMLCVNVAAATLNLQIPAAFIDDNIHIGTPALLDAELQKYWQHLHTAGLKDKASKRERFCAGDILGRWFDSSPPMTVSVPADKMRTLQTIMGELLEHPCMTLKEVQSFAGFWEFCCEVMPAYLKAFISSTHTFTKKFGGKQRHLWCPKDMRKDVRTIRHLLKTASNYCLLHPKAGRQKAPPVTGDARGGARQRERTLRHTEESGGSTQRT